MVEVENLNHYKFADDPRLDSIINDLRNAPISQEEIPSSL